MYAVRMHFLWIGEQYERISFVAVVGWGFNRMMERFTKETKEAKIYTRVVLFGRNYRCIGSTLL